MPNGSMILDPTMEEVPDGVDELHTAAKFVGDYVRDHEPDIVVLATGHGINLSDSIGVYGNHVATGAAEWNRHWRDYKVSANLNEQFSREIFDHLQVTHSLTLEVYNNKRVMFNKIIPESAEQENQVKPDSVFWRAAGAARVERGGATIFHLGAEGHHRNEEAGVPI